MAKIDFIHARNQRGEILEDVDAFFEIPNKWLPVLCKLVEELTPAVEHLGDIAADFYFLQAKEKFGHLCFYPTFINDEISQILSAYESIEL